MSGRSLYSLLIARETIAVKGTFGPDGRKWFAAVAEGESTTLPAKDVIRCVLGVFRSLRYQESHGGKVNVVYKVLFAPQRT